MPFQLKYSDTIAVYGDTLRAEIIIQTMREKGFKNLFIIDQVKQENKVVTFEQLIKHGEKLDNIVVVISLQNAMAHSMIADKFFRYGIRKIVFLPADIRTQSITADIMRRNYNILINGDIDTNTRLPYYNEIIPQYKIRTTNGVIFQDDDMTVFWAHINQIYINNTRRHVVEENEIYYGRPFILADHYQALFNYFERGVITSSLDRYMKAQSYINEAGSFNMEKLQDRYLLWLLYKKEFNRGMYFFISSASEVTMRANGGLNIIDGLHRLIFLYLQNVSYFPVKMKTEEFKVLYNDECLGNEHISKFQHKIDNLKFPIEHPAFYQIQAGRAGIEPSILSAIRLFIGLSDIEDYNVLDISTLNGYFARNISMMKRKSGNGKIYSIELDKEEFLFTEYINNLLGTSSICNIFNDNLLCINNIIFDLVFAIGRYETLSDFCNWLPSISNCTKRFLFWETEDILEPSQIRIIEENVGFKEVRKILEFFDGEKRKQVFVLIKEENWRQYGEEINI